LNAEERMALNGTLEQADQFEEGTLVIELRFATVQPVNVLPRTIVYIFVHHRSPVFSTLSMHARLYEEK